MRLLLAAGCWVWCLQRAAFWRLLTPPVPARGGRPPVSRHSSAAFPSVPRQTLPCPLQGLFAVANRLFGVTIEPADGEVPVWHEDVRFFRVKKVGVGSWARAGCGVVRRSRSVSHCVCAGRTQRQGSRLGLAE